LTNGSTNKFEEDKSNDSLWPFYFTPHVIYCICPPLW
jgi:hypothetical protein